MAEITLEFLGRQIARLIEDVATVRIQLAHVETQLTDIRGGMNVHFAMLQRQHNTLENVVSELQSIHQFNARTHERLRALADAP